jgi:ankyrin repeat protein
MILAAIGVATTKECLNKCKSLGGNPAAVDKEGWNALHWAAYHGSPAGATYLLSDDGYGGIKLGLADAKDKEGKIPLDHAKAEGNTEVVTIIENAMASGEVPASDDGLRKRK